VSKWLGALCHSGEIGYNLVCLDWLPVINHSGELQRGNKVLKNKEMNRKSKKCE
jgi:hypothetical protein